MMGERKVSVFSVLVLIISLLGLGVGAYSLYNYQQLISQVDPPEPTKPLARAFLNTSYAIPGFGWNVVNFTVLDYDTTGDFNITTDRFICPTSGYYLISGMIMFSSMNDGEIIYVAAHREGVVEAGSTAQASTNGGISTGFSDIVYLNEGDYVELLAFHTVTGQRTIYGDSAGTYTYFTIAATDILN
jgi:hypothetical protein